MKIAVFGATVTTVGMFLARSPSRPSDDRIYETSPGIDERSRTSSRVHGDGRDLAKVREAVDGQDCVIAVVSSPELKASTIVSEVTKNIITAMQETGVRRLICVSSHSLVATHPWLVVKLVKWMFRHPYADLAAMEQAMVSSHLDWTIVRATQLTDGLATGHVRRVHGDFDAGPYTISRADLASVLLDTAESAGEVQAALEVSGAKNC